MRPKSWQRAFWSECCSQSVLEKGVVECSPGSPRGRRSTSRCAWTAAGTVSHRRASCWPASQTPPCTERHRQEARPLACTQPAPQCHSDGSKTVCVRRLSLVLVYSDRQTQRGCHCQRRAAAFGGGALLHSRPALPFPLPPEPGRLLRLLPAARASSASASMASSCDATARSVTTSEPARHNRATQTLGISQNARTNF